MMYKDPRDLAELREMLVGATVEAVDDNEDPEGMVKITVCRKDGKRVMVPIFANSLGWWFGNKKEVVDGDPLYTSPEAMLTEMADFGYHHQSQERLDDFSCDPLEDVERKRVGFRIEIKYDGQTEQRDFWIALASCKGSPWSEPLQTPEGRRWVAQHSETLLLWECPDPRKVPGTLEPWAGKV